MAADIETMFYVREVPWHGLGTKVLEAPASRDVLIVAGLNWQVIQKPIYTDTGELTEKQVSDYMKMLLLMPENASKQQKKNISYLRDGMKVRYFDTPDLQDIGHNAYRFINAVSDFAIHSAPLRRTKNYQEKMKAV